MYICLLCGRTQFKYSNFALFSDIMSREQGAFTKFEFSITNIEKDKRSKIIAFFKFHKSVYSRAEIGSKSRGRSGVCVFAAPPKLQTVGCWAKGRQSPFQAVVFCRVRIISAASAGGGRGAWSEF